MIGKLEQLKSKVNLTRTTLERLKADYKQVEQAVIENPGGNSQALEAAKLELQVKAVEKALKAATEALTAEETRLKSPEALKELKELDKLNADLEKRQEAIFEDLQALNAKFDEIEAVYKEAKTIARRYDQKPYNWEKWGLFQMRNQIQQWARIRHSWERHQEIMARPDRGVQPVNKPTGSPRRDF